MKTTAGPVTNQRRMWWTKETKKKWEGKKCGEKEWTIDAKYRIKKKKRKKMNKRQKRKKWEKVSVRELMRMKTEEEKWSKRQVIHGQRKSTNEWEKR